jgi:hypothetical protein
MAQVPQYDLLPALERYESCDVELFTERTVHALLDSPERFDCVVVGYNAAYKSREIRTTLAAHRVPVGLLVLHQLKPEALSFLAGEYSLDAVELVPPAEGAIVPREFDPHDQIVLNWPEGGILQTRVSEHELPNAKAYLGLKPQPGSRWRTVLETRHDRARLAVLVRTDRRSSPPVAVSSVLLAPRRPEHLALLKNLLMWCGAGRPTAVVVGTPDAPDTAIVHRKLRLQGVKAVADEVPAREALDFRSWPLWGTQDAVLPEDWDPTQVDGWPHVDPHNVKPWLRRGHRVVLLGPGASLTVRHGESDAHWVASKWATWFNDVPTETWHGGQVAGQEFEGSIVATRSILRMLAALHRTSRDTTLPGLATVHAVLDSLAEQGIEIAPASLGVPQPMTFLKPVAKLIERRLGADDSVDSTVSATVAVLDIDALLGRQALGPRRAKVIAWLRAQLADCALEDRLEIARCLGDHAVLTGVIVGAEGDVRLGQPVSAVMVTALRSALVACDAPDDTDLRAFKLNPEFAVVDRELRMRPMLAAGYLIGVLDLQRIWKSQRREPARTLRDPPAERVDRAVITLGRYGPLSRGDTSSDAPVPELASTEALALIAYFARHSVPTHVVVGSDKAPQSLHVLLEEGERARSENRRLDEELHAAKERAARAGPALALSGEALIIAFVILFAIVLSPHLSDTWEPPTSFGLWALLTLGLLALLGHYGLPVPRAKRVAPWLAGGFSALRQDLARAVAGEPSPPATGAARNGSAAAAADAVAPAEAEGPADADDAGAAPAERSAGGR